MDIADLAADSSRVYEKCDRVRSWYTYEQLKSLERDQQDATRRLKSKSFDRFLRRGFSEKRVNRRLSDQFSTTQSGHSRLQCTRRMSELVTTTTCSLDNFADTCEQEINFFNMDSKESIISYDLDVTRDYDMPNLNMTNSNLLKNVKDIEDLELYDGEISEHETFDSCDLPIAREASNSMLSKYVLNTDTLMSTWSKLVAHAHRIIKLQHGANCYVEYSSQLLTAVLVVDVLRMLVGRMCDILQPIVCLINFNCVDAFDFKERKITSNEKKYSHYLVKLC